MTLPNLQIDKDARPDALLFSPAFLRLLVIQFAFGISFSAFLLLPKFLRTEFNASATELGSIAGVALIAAALVAPFVGLAAKHFDRRLLLALALILEGGGAILFVFVDRVGPLVYALRLAQGIAFVLVFNCTATMAAENLPSQRLAQGVGLLGVAMMVTNAFAPLLVEPMAETWGWKICFVVAGLCALSALWVLPLLDPPERALPIAHPNSPTSRPLGAVFYGAFLMGGGLGAMFTFIQPFALQLGVSRVGPFFIGYVAMAIFVRVALGSLADKVGPPKVAAISLAFYALVTGTSSQLTPLLLAPLGMGLGLSHGLMYPALSATGLSRTPPPQRSIFMGWFTCAFNAGFAFTVLILGPVADHYGYPLLFLLVGALLLTGIIPLAHMHRLQSKDASMCSDEKRRASGYS